MNRTLPLLALALTLPLAACGADDTDDTAVVEPTTPAVDPMMEDNTTMNGDMAMNDVTAQSTLDAVPAGGLTEMAPSAALSNIDSWIAQLDGATFTNSTEIRDGLMTLRDQLQATPIDGSAVGETLTNLGTWTVEAAGTDTALTNLGNALQSAGQNLTSM